jgi:hypothetical protein
MKSPRVLKDGSLQASFEGSQYGRWSGARASHLGTNRGAQDRVAVNHSSPEAITVSRR